MKKTFITYAKRTPIAKINGALSSVRVDDLLAELFKDFKQQAKFDLKEIDDVIVGCANQAGEDNRNIARMSLLLAGFPNVVPGVTVNRLCASSLDAVIDAIGRINLGLADCILVGGAESMTRAPLVISKGSTPFGRDSKMYDSTFGWRFPNPKMEEMFPLWSMGRTAEELAIIHDISRKEQDEFALRSHKLAIKAKESGYTQKEILPIEIKQRKTTFTFSEDECPRSDTSLDKLEKLRTVFLDGGTVTAGNASSMNDGAACLMVVSEEFLKKHKLTPLAEITGAGIRGVDPNTMGIGPVESTKVLLEKFNKKIEDFDAIELNEAFSAQALACIKELKLDIYKVNQFGGAIALGHPLGCSGARIVTTLLNVLASNENYKEGLATMCVGVGQGVSLSLKKC